MISLRARSSFRPVGPVARDIFELSARYRPMLRLLDGADFDLITEAGDPRLMRKVRSARREIFRGYLRSLRRDHACLCHQIRTQILNASTDRQDLASTLFRVEWRFRLLMSVVETKLLLHSLGVGTVSAGRLVASLETISRKAELMSSSAIAIAA